MISITENGNVRYENQTDVDRELLANEKSPKYYYDETVRLSAAAQTAQEAAEEAAEAAMASTPEGYADFVDNLAPAYSSSATYSAGDYVLHESILYRANADISTAEDWTAAHWTEVRTMTEVSDLKEDLNERFDSLDDSFVSLTGENQVQPQNIAGVTFTKTEEETEGSNIFTSDMLFEAGYYVAVNTSVNPPITAHTENALYNSYCIPVSPNTKYNITQARFACGSKGNTIGSEATTEALAYISTITTDADTNYLFLSYSTSVSASDISVKPVTVTEVYSDFVMPYWMQQNTSNTKTKYSKGTGSFAASGDYILLANTRSDLRKGTRLVFECTVTSGTDFQIGFSVNGSGVNSPHNIIGFTSENITYNSVNYAHGLTITGRVQVVFEYLDNGTADITLFSNGRSFKQNIVFSNNSPAVAYVRSQGMIASDCKLTFTCTDFTAEFWLFGDSYIQYDDKRWAYYLHQYGYDKNMLLDGFAGEGSVNARVAMNSLLSFGTPKYAVWCMGMNDGSDTNDTTPSSNWVSGRDYFLSYCNNNKITPVFATIPSVPTINHKGKNAWIKTSGYRYVDFAHAVGADTNVNWYDGMLDNDGVHPTEYGAKALFAQFLLDFPEVMLT